MFAGSVAQLTKEITDAFFHQSNYDLSFSALFFLIARSLEIQVSFLPYIYLHFTSAAQNYLLGTWACWTLFPTNESKMPQSDPRTVHHLSNPVNLSSINDTLFICFWEGSWQIYVCTLLVFGSSLSHLLSHFHSFLFLYGLFWPWSKIYADWWKPAVTNQKRFAILLLSGCSFCNWSAAFTAAAWDLALIFVFKIFSHPNCPVTSLHLIVNAIFNQCPETQIFPSLNLNQNPSPVVMMKASVSLLSLSMIIITDVQGPPLNSLVSWNTRISQICKREIRIFNAFMIL